MSKSIRSVWDWAVKNYPVPYAAKKANAEWVAKKAAEDELPPAVSTALQNTRDAVFKDIANAANYVAGQAAAAAVKAMAAELEHTVAMMKEQTRQTQQAVRVLGERYQSSWECGVAAFIEAEAKRKMALDTGDNQYWHDVILGRLTLLERRITKLEMATGAARGGTVENGVENGLDSGEKMKQENGSHDES